MIVVFDSGVWISALHFGGAPLLALDNAYVHDEIAVCEQIEAEIRRVLADKFGWKQVELDFALTGYLSGASCVGVEGKLFGVCRDPKDDMIVECAVNSRAEIIVSGDRDLLVLGEYRSVRILSPREYMNSPM